MKVLILSLISILPVAAQITASPSSVKVTMRRMGAFPMQASRPPAPVQITISGTGSWNMSRSGSLSTACGAAYGYCFNAVNSVGTLCNGALPTGSDAGTTWLCFNGLVTSNLAVGTHTGTLTIGSTNIAITLVVEEQNAYSAWGGLLGYPVGCSNSNASQYDTVDTCTITDERPTSTAFSIPAQGGSYVDPQFGSTVTRITASGQNIQYGALSAFSATGKYIMTSDLSGNVDIYNRATATEAYANVPSVNINFAAWDPYDDEKLWFMDGASIKYRVLSTSTTTTAATYAYNLTMGGTVDITDDGWWAFRNSATNAGDICAVNLNGLTTGNQSSKTFCASMSSLSLTDIDFTQITQVDSESNKRYVIAVAAPSAQVWSVGSSGLVYEYPIPSGNGGDVTVEPHSDVGQDEMGRQVFWWNWYDPYGNRYYLGAIQLNKGAEMTRPVEAGGGLRILALDNPADFTTDAHFGCTWRGVCTYTPYGNSGGITAKQIQSITAANPCQINSTSHGYSSSDSVQIGGAAGTGVSAMNAIHTVTVVSANAYTIPVDCSSGWTYTANSAHSALSAASASKPFRQEIMISRVGQWVRRLAIHRSKIYSGGSLVGYYATPRASVSRDGAYMAYASNMGVPEQASVYVVATGITTAQRLAVSTTPADTSVVFNYTMPSSNQLSATIVISTSPMLATPVVNASDGLTTVSRQYVASGLSADTVYYFRISTTGYSNTGSFRTAPTLTGTSILSLVLGGGGSIQYGPTSALGNSGASPLTLTVSKGLYYYNNGGGVQAIVVR